MLLLNQCLDPKMSHIISGSFSLVHIGYKPAAGLHGEVQGVFIHCFFSFGIRTWSESKRKLLEDSKWELEELHGVCKTQRGFQEQCTGECRKVSSSPFTNLAVPSSGLRMWQSPCVSLWGYFTSSSYSNSLSSFLVPFCSHSSHLPSALPCPALFELWYPAGFVEEPGEEQ